MKTPFSIRRSRPSRSTRGRRIGRRGFTLVEIMIAGFVMALLFGGLLRMIIQSRRVTEGSITQNGVAAWIQGYVQQLQSINYNSIPVSPAAAPEPDEPSPLIPMLSGLSAPDPFLVSWGGAPAVVGAAGVTPDHGIENARTLPFKAPPVNLKLWVWVEETSDALTQVSMGKTITLVYDYDVVDGNRVKRSRGMLRTIRSAWSRY